MKYPTVSSLCEGIAESIRRKEGSTEKINPQDFPERIEALQSGSGGESGGLMMEYLGVNKDNFGSFTLLSLTALIIKIIDPIDGSVMIVPSSMLANLQEDETIDFRDVIVAFGTAANAQCIMQGDIIPLWGGVVNTTIDAEVENGTFNRITKEQFYSLE